MFLQRICDNMNQIFLIYVLTLTVGMITGEELEEVQIQPRETSSCENRQAPGIICESCELLATCVKFTNGWANIPIESCDTQNGFYCNANLGKCSNATGPCHPFGFEGNFPCTKQGIFPDPYDCQRYHMCYFVESTLVSASVDCGADKAFSAATGECSLSLQHAVCREKQFECLNAGDAHPWPNNPNIFYVCKASSNTEVRVLYPTLYRCDAGEIFNGYFCNPSTQTVLPTPTIEPNTSSISSTSITTPDINCTKLGFIHDPNNCKMYYYCSGINGVLKHNECPSGTHFNKAISSCSLGTCTNA